LRVIRLRSAVCTLGRFPALAGVDLDVDTAEILLVSGPNGAGKTTLLRLCAGLLPLRAGTAEVLGVDLSKQQQLSDWGADSLTDAQVSYAATDVLYLHALKEKLDAMLAREDRAELAAACFRFLPDRARLDLAGWATEDIFSHSI